MRISPYSAQIVPCISIYKNNSLSQIAVSNDHIKTDTVKFSGMFSTDNEKFLLTAQRNRIYDIDRLLNKGAQINYQDPITGQTALHYAASKGFLPFVEDLLERHAAREVRDNLGQTPLHCAIPDRMNIYHVQVLETLIKHGVKVDTLNNDKQTALHLASKGGHLEAVKILALNRANPHLPDKFGMTPIDYAKRYNYTQIANFLASQPVDPKSASPHSNPVPQISEDASLTNLNTKTESKPTHKQHFPSRPASILSHATGATTIRLANSISERTLAPERVGLNESIFSSDSTSQRSVAPERPGLNESIFSSDSTRQRSGLPVRPRKQDGSSANQVNPSGENISPKDQATAERVFTLINSNFLFEPEAQGIANRLNRDVARHLAHLFQAARVSEDDAFQLSSDQLRASHEHPDICRFWRDFSNSYPWQNH